jgi:hypothetical protein
MQVDEVEHEELLPRVDLVVALEVKGEQRRGGNVEGEASRI